MKLKNKFENKKLIFESIGKTVALLVASIAFVIGALYFKMYNEEPFLFWIGMLFFGFGIINSLYRLVHPKYMFLAPKSKLAEEYREQDFEKKYNQDGIFEYDGSGFQIVLEDQVSYYNWKDISTVFGYKKDLYSVDLICLDAFNENGKGFSINEETEGWFRFLRQLKRNITGIPEYWEIEIADPAFETNLTLLFDTQNRSFEALATEFYNERF